MRVALISEFYFPHLGGVTEHVHNLATRLNDAGHHAIVITSRMAPPQRGHDLKESKGDPPFVRRIGTSRLIYSSGSFARITTGVGLRRQIRNILREEKIDLVHVHGGLAPVLGLVAPEAASDLNLPTVATFHSWFHRSTLTWLFQRNLQYRLNRLAAAIAVSQPVVDAYSRYLSADWLIIPNGVDTDFFHPNGQSDTSTSRPVPELLFLGRLDPRNGLDTLLSAMPKVLEHFPEARLTVAGDGPLRPVYQRLAAPIARHVTFLGRVNGERPNYYARADLYLCPTTKASFGMTLLEAMACGTPMAVSDITGFRELVNGGDEAVLVPVANGPAWGDAIVSLLRDDERRRRMRAAGLTKAAQFAWPSVVDRVMAVYEKAAR
ncbi:MAG: glycosyltransferase family 4 protein [Gemmatimonadota bacterium]